MDGKTLIGSKYGGKDFGMTRRLWSRLFVVGFGESFAAYKIPEQILIELQNLCNPSHLTGGVIGLC